jgi:hypothetical protein
MDAHMTQIKAPLVKSATAIAAAVGANTEAAGQAAVSVIQAIAPTSDPLWYWFIVSLPWDKIASFVAAVYTMMLASEWLFKKIWRGWLREFAVRRGWVPGEVLMSRRQWAAMGEDD